ncbi:hypothetical protein PV620_18625 [Streptomyces sp. ME02-6978a]|uniref:hypothetical protein n=1 Tax=unclassified Streptomyces TaxID=2593676 RepID=UPI0029B3F3E8|nr:MULTISPECIES: hypothetical protein [unclassified Streptomyces]MDX3090115.1 hypothetical protein [Streptomyces sp. ME12-02E]MDX3333575.1 hypothetical protein [Streptomyces sp. ME02-6978a]
MHTGHKAMTGFVTAIFTLLVLITGLMTRWPSWAWLLSGALLVTGVAFSLVRERRKTPLIPPEYRSEPDLPVPPRPRWECTVRDVALPSSTEDYDFLFSATIRWVPQEAMPDPLVVNAGGLAMDNILERARRITEKFPPHRCALVQHRLDGELAMLAPDASGWVTAMAEGVRLRLEDADRVRLEKLATVRKDEALWEHERKWEQNRRAYLREDVLKTPGSAVVWWLSRNDEQIDKAVADIGLLAELASAAHDQPVPPDFHRFVPGLPPSETTGGPAPVGAAPRTPEERVDLLLDAMGMAEDDPHLALFIDRVARDADHAQRNDIAEALRRRKLRFMGGEEPSSTPRPPSEDTPPGSNAEPGENL